MENYLGEIRIFAGNFAPQNWHLCDGSTLNINDYVELFSLIGTIYGGDEVSTFKLPDLRSNVIIGTGTLQSRSPYILGQKGGTSAVSLTIDTMPSHNHSLQANTNLATTGDPNNNMLAVSNPVGTSGYPNVKMYASLPSGTLTPGSILDPLSVTYAGNGQPHSNIMPNIHINYIIALRGIFPS
jgi:microcystin-dependent protein